ncbi:MAG: DegV family protein [Metamycoplasmataceae bacterium]
MKLAIVVDSSCGLTKKQAEKKGWFYLPLIINIDGIEYRDGIDITPENFYKMYKKESISFTSATPPGETLKLFKKLSAEYDQVIVYPISSGLSSQYETLIILAKEFSNVKIIKSKEVTYSIIADLIKLEEDIKNNDLTYKQGIKIFEERKFDSKIRCLYLIPKHNDALLNGGRLTPSAAKLAKLLKIVPVIIVKDGKLEKFEKGRIFDRTVIRLFENHYKNILKTISEENKLTLFLLDVKCADRDKLYEAILKVIDGNPNVEIVKSYIPPVVAIHTGLESVILYFEFNAKKVKNYINLN